MATGEPLNWIIIKIGQHTAKSPGDLRSRAVTQTPVRNYKLTLMWKSFKELRDNKSGLYRPNWPQSDFFNLKRNKYFDPFWE